jgi:hypothetical protein
MSEVMMSAVVVMLPVELAIVIDNAPSAAETVAVSTSVAVITPAFIAA